MFSSSMFDYDIPIDGVDMEKLQDFLEDQRDIKVDALTENDARELHSNVDNAIKAFAKPDQFKDLMLSHMCLSCGSLLEALANKLAILGKAHTMAPLFDAYADDIVSTWTSNVSELKSYLDMLCKIEKLASIEAAANMPNSRINKLIDAIVSNEACMQRLLTSEKSVDLSKQDENVTAEVLYAEAALKKIADTLPDVYADKFSAYSANKLKVSDAAAPDSVSAARPSRR